MKHYSNARSVRVRRAALRPIAAVARSPNFTRPLRFLPSGGARGTGLDVAMALPKSQICQREISQ
ncbi:MAG: hypothetical protein ACPHYE_02705 [Henriciella sp.]